MWRPGSTMSVLFLLWCVVLVHSAAVESLQGGVHGLDVNGGSSEEAIVIMQLQCFLGCSEEGRDLQHFNVVDCVTACTEFHKELPQNCELQCENSTTCIVGCRLCKEAANTAPPKPASAPILTLIDERVATGPLDYMIEFPSDSESYGYIILVEDSNTRSYIPVVDRKSSLPLSAAHACQHVNVSYANVGRCSTSEYSLPTTLHVSGIPNPPGNVQVRLEEDFRDGYLGHATLNVTWERPSNVGCVSHYSLLMSSVAHRRCIKQEITIPHIDGDANSILIQSEDPSQIPFFNCKYKLTLLSHPNTGANATVTIQTIFTGPRSPLNMDCLAVFNSESKKYDVTVKWREEPSVIQAISYMYIRVLSPMFAISVGSKAMQHTIHNLEPKDAHEGLYYIHVIPYKNTTYNWRRIPSDNSCVVAAPPFPPSQVRNITVQGMMLYENKTLDVVLSWEPPEFLNGELRGYVLRIGRQPADQDEKHSLTLNNIKTSITHVNVRGTLLWYNSETMPIVYLQMRAINEYMSSEWSSPVELNTSATTSTTSNHRKNSKTIVYAPIISAVLLIAILVLALNVVLVCVHKYCVKLKKRSLLEKRPTGHEGMNVYHYDQPMSQLQLRSHTVDRWELNPMCVIVDMDQEVMRNCTCYHNGKMSEGYIDLGGGRMGHSVDKKKESTLTIKTLGDNSTGIEKESFLKEIENMKKVSEADSELGRFVVNMVGCVTIQEPLLLVLECNHYGDLLTYLRENRRKSEYASSIRMGRRATIVHGKIEKSDLWDFAWQISGGMAFLADCGIVHGSLACHNICIGKDKRLKISNFGAYTCNPGSAHLRWMAPESISRHEFKTASDVWAYGIVLWEICTMGGFPYPIISDQDLPRLLQGGHRLEQPENVPPEMYDIMTQCWCQQPHKRPTFTALHSTTNHFLQLLQKMPTSDQEDIYVALDDLELL